MMKTFYKAGIVAAALGVLPSVAQVDYEAALTPRNLVWANDDFSTDWQNVGFIGDGQQGASILLDNVNSNDLRCEGAHLVSAKRVDGKTQWLELTAGRDGDVMVKTDIANPKPTRN